VNEVHPCTIQRRIDCFFSTKNHDLNLITVVRELVQLLRARNESIKRKE